MKLDRGATNRRARADAMNSDDLITLGQLLGIGFGYGIAGPCLLTCAPFTLGIVGSGLASARRALLDMLLFLGGRSVAYILLGAAAGVSSAWVERFAHGLGLGLTPRAWAGLLSILLGAWMLWRLRWPPSHRCGAMAMRLERWGLRGGLAWVGFCIGLAPCAPLLGLLAEIALIAHGPWSGMAYAGAFALGTLLAGLLVAVPLSWLGRWLAHCRSRDRVLRGAQAVAAGLLILVGVLMVAAYA